MKKSLLVSVIASLILVVSASLVVAAQGADVPKKKQTTLGLYMSAKEAYDHMQAQGDKALFLDVRSHAEVNFLGMPTVADANIPYMQLSEWNAFDDKKQSYVMDVNSEFATQVERRLQAKGLGKDDTIIVLCRSGSRSAKAADLLAKLGYTRVYSVLEGYEGDKAKEGPHAGQRVVNGWRNQGLPWTYKLERNKMTQIASN
ncbi:MAG: sulfurtransferase [Gammaproteobacteria bacterium]|nr:sulfurtransferase [Gammaproteobacteria bacterium]MDX5374990.1 sulfurtransferase [Gammaproteobacteria bacterium]